MDPRRRPPQCKTYGGLESVELPTDIDTHRISRLLFGMAGVVRVATYGEQTMLFRAAGSAGNLQPLEVYLLDEGGLFHYDAPNHALTRLRDVPEGTPPALVVTGVPWRTGWKYGERGFRHLYWDAGSMLAHTLELEPRARIELGFADRDVAALVGADGVHEVPLAVVGLEGETHLPEPDGVPAGFLAEDPLEFPLVTAVQHSGDLDSAQQVADWRSAPASAANVAWSPAGELTELIRRRGSTRTFDPSRSASGELLFEAMAWATRPVPCDFTSSTLLEHNLVVHAVDGLEPGTYRWPDATPLREGPMRTEAKFLCLGQDLGGDGVYTVFHSSRVDELDDRRYRAALLEAGVVSGRLHLAAFSLGAGATGLTYFDEEVRGFFDTPAWPLLVTAVGIPAYRNSLGGTPRRPTVLRR
jgi:hypothetical protein